MSETAEETYYTLFRSLSKGIKFDLSALIHMKADVLATLALTKTAPKVVMFEAIARYRKN